VPLFVDAIFGRTGEELWLLTVHRLCSFLPMARRQQIGTAKELIACHFLGDSHHLFW
jgi:hypothetical protein